MSYRGQNRRGSRRSAPRGSSPNTGKRHPAPKKKTPRVETAAQQPAEPLLPPLRLGFVRGVAPSKWSDRWARVVRNQTLELVPIALEEEQSARALVDVLLERTAPSQTPEGSSGATANRHAIRLYDEGVALVVDIDHELAKKVEVDLDDLALVNLLDHPDHLDEWPAAPPWRDPDWMPQGAESALELVATGMGGVLLPFPLARHLSGRRTHSVIPVANGGEGLLQGTRIWATWSVDRDAGDIQRLIGVMRGRTPRSSR